MSIIRTMKICSPCQIFIRWILFFCVSSFYFGRGSPELFSRGKMKSDHLMSPLDDSLLSEIYSTTDAKALKDVFRNVNIIRPAGSKELSIVRSYIKNYLIHRNWSVELDSFSQNTVIGHKKFSNIIATFDVRQHRNLVLACHYESKLMPDFFGSTDSAMPCSIILLVADKLTKRLQAQRNSDIGLQLIFFDGEEAFLEWSSTDSLYGARHLAAKWQSVKDSNGQPMLKRMALLVLLDLIGATGLHIPNYRLANDHYYAKLVEFESQMRQTGLLRSAGRYFGSMASSYVQDDHLPFYERGVPVLHLIPDRFPPVWHTPEDNASAIDWNVSLDMLNLVEAFVRSYLHLI